jgi:hypothetical protein
MHARGQGADALPQQPGGGGVDEGSALLSAYEQEEAFIDTGSSNGNNSPGAHARAWDPAVASSGQSAPDCCSFCAWWSSRAGGAGFMGAQSCWPMASSQRDE